MYHCFIITLRFFNCVRQNCQTVCQNRVAEVLDEAKTAAVEVQILCRSCTRVAERMLDMLDKQCEKCLRSILCIIILLLLCVFFICAVWLIGTPRVADMVITALEYLFFIGIGINLSVLMWHFAFWRLEILVGNFTLYFLIILNIILKVGSLKSVYAAVHGIYSILVYVFLDHFKSQGSIRGILFPIATFTQKLCMICLFVQFCIVMWHNFAVTYRSFFKRKYNWKLDFYSSLYFLFYFVHVRI